jgi:hypothetical protein
VVVTRRFGLSLVQWVPNSFQPPIYPMAKLGYRFTVGGLGDVAVGSVAASGGKSVGTLMLPGCLDRRDLAPIRGSRAALDDVLCVGKRDGAAVERRPFAVALLQLDSPVPASSTPRQAARGELWRLTLLQARAPSSRQLVPCPHGHLRMHPPHLPCPRTHPTHSPPHTLFSPRTRQAFTRVPPHAPSLQALSEQTSLAALGGLKCDVSFNVKGMRLVVSGYAQRLPKYTALLLRR